MPESPHAHVPPWPRFDREPHERARERRFTLAALAASLLIHLALIWLVPDQDLFLGTAGEQDPASDTIYEVSLQEEPEQQPMRFVETNPEVVENEPDETANVSNRDQQAAQENPNPLSRDTEPTVDGESPDSQKIVEGDLGEPAPAAPPAQADSQPRDPQVPTPEQTADRAAVPPQPEPAPDFLEGEPDPEADGEGAGLFDGPTGEADELPEDKAEREVIPVTRPPDRPTPEQQETRPKRAVSPSPDSQPQPQPRPRLPQPRVVPGPLMQSAGVASRSGAVAVDARFSEFGDYAQRMVEAVSRAWNSQVARAPENIGERPSRVQLRFVLNSFGEVKEMETVTTSASALDTAMCRDAIQSRSPYGIWTEDMINVLGMETTLTFTFHYR
ncbi:MAG: hypothetical protein ACFE0O_12790 [Opitutales bacterium]